MLARGIRSYHRPARKAQALELLAQGVRPLAGGTRLLATPADVPNVLDVVALGLNRVDVRDGDLVVGATVTVQDLIDSPAVHAGSSGLLPAAARAHSASRMLRGMATIGGESVHRAHDSELLAALLALNAVYVVERGSERSEIPAVRFLRDPQADLEGGGLLTSLFVPGPPQGAALERVAVLPSAPALVAVAVAVSLSAGRCTRARIAAVGLEAGPARVTDAEARLEGTAAGEEDVVAAVEEVARARYREDAHAPAAYRREASRVLARRALQRALAQARGAPAPAAGRARSALAPRRIPELPYFTSGRIEIRLNGADWHADTEARATLLQLLRREGLWGVKHGCETGECGSCTVLLDGKPVVACLTLALRAHGRSVQTVEGLGSPDALHPIQQAFVDTGAIQCGYCTPAMELCAKALLDTVPRPNEDEVRDALAGCLCRCTGYVKPVQAVLQAARELSDGDRGSQA
jgi:aerobic-type carbon monoxide dehydrogenase small subunit (CoxS/CutS family)/CO/xanthine dehydrogenase FAD-binding subunit